MPQILDDEVAKGDQAQAAELAAMALGARPVRVVRLPLTFSGNAIYRVYQPDGTSAVLRISGRPRTFAYTQRNLEVLRALGLPVQSVLASGRTSDGGSYVILTWMPGEDLVHELGGMTRAQMTRLAEQIVEYQRRLGALPWSKGFGWAPIGQNASLPNWTAVFGEAAEPALLDDGTLLGKLRARLGLIRGGLESYFSTVPAKAFLDDLTTKNVLVKDGALCGIIDVDFVCYGDPLLAVGATMAFIAADIGAAGRFYGEELLRCWNPSRDARRAARFYAANWMIGFLSAAAAAGESARTAELTPMADEMLRIAEAE